MTQVFRRFLSETGSERDSRVTESGEKRGEGCGWGRRNSDHIFFFQGGIRLRAFKQAAARLAFFIRASFVSTIFVALFRCGSCIVARLNADTLSARTRARA